MPRDIQLSNGQTLRNVPDNISTGGALDLARQRGLLTTEQVNETLGMAQQQTETGGTLNEVAIGAGKFFADRSFGAIANDIARPDTLAAGIGEALPGIAASFAVPGSVLAQGALGFGLEATREGASIESSLGAGALQGGFAGAGNLLGRVFSRTKGLSPTAGQRLAQRSGRTVGDRVARAVSDPVQRLEAGIQSAGGFGALKQATTRELNRSIAKSFGQRADELTPQVFSKAADDIGDIFNTLMPDSMNISSIRSALDDMAKGIPGTRVTRSLGEADDLGKQGLVALRANLVARQRALMRDAPTAADDLAVIIDDFDNLIATAIGPDALPLLRIAREGWKNLRLAESLPSVVKTGNASPGQLLARLRNPNSGYGTTFIRDRGGVLPETQGMFNAARSAGKLQDIVGDSGTATRMLALGAVGGIGGLIAEGDIEGALKWSALGLAPVLLGRASAGQASALATRVGGASGATLFPFIKGADDEAVENQ